MPEGPQVKRVGNMIAKFEGDSILEIPRKPESKVFDLVLPAKLLRVEVKGKNIFVYLKDKEGEKVLYNHMLMWGKWDLGCEPKSGNKSLNTCFTFKKGSLGYYGGGILKIVTVEQAEKMKKKLGPDILQSKTMEETFVKVRKSRKPIGEAIMAQELVSGIGNIYKSEGLFAAQIYPEKKANELSEEDYQKLFAFLHKQMTNDVTSGTIITTTPKLFKQGHRRYVYRKYHQLCLVCGKKIERMIQNGRSTYFCPNCQK